MISNALTNHVDSVWYSQRAAARQGEKIPGQGGVMNHGARRPRDGNHAGTKCRRHSNLPAAPRADRWDLYQTSRKFVLFMVCC